MAFNSLLMKGMLFSEDYVLAHTTNISLKTYKKGNQIIGKQFRKMKTMQRQDEEKQKEEPKKEMEMENLMKKEEEKATLEDAFIFIQCENSSYLIEKSLGRGEKMLVLNRLRSNFYLGEIGKYCGSGEDRFF